ncbi:MAG: thiamine-phosphate kinase [Candidatus Omnitrophica bacterium]|nr:thiamine-phosphate kinase [Candidatus Omnitrophota bacterium]
MRRRPKTIESVGEFGLIDQIKKWIPPMHRSVVCGIGDDAAVFPMAGGGYQLLTIDTVVEDVDFKMNRATPQQIGWKALGVGLSDLAAMGGIPKMAVISLTLPRRTPLRFVRDFYEGIRKLARRFRVSIVGGDLSRGPKISSSIAVLGEATRTSTVFRSGAKIGDLICVTGRLGGSILGKHLNFLPRLREGQFLARRGVSAMIDLSDGLGQDLNHLISNSRTAFMIDEAKVPISEAARKLARGNLRRELIHAFCDGEDFELLFTIPRSKLGTLQRAWPKRFSIPLTVIGQVMRLAKGMRPTYRYQGYRHF